MNGFNNKHAARDNEYVPLRIGAQLAGHGSGMLQKKPAPQNKHVVSPGGKLLAENLVLCTTMQAEAGKRSVHQGFNRPLISLVNFFFPIPML